MFLRQAWRRIVSEDDTTWIESVLERRPAACVLPGDVVLKTQIVSPLSEFSGPEARGAGVGRID
jgi:hypothetical protein